MGYENLAYYVAEYGWEILDDFYINNGSLPLEFVVDPRETNMFSFFGENAYLFEDHNLTFNAHNWGIK